jgi:two-component system response regulator HydG
MSKGRVLAVDDKPNMRHMLRDLLSDEYEVTTAENGERALALVEAGDFDVMVSDIRMPGMDGYALLSELKRGRPQVEVILITAYASLSRAVEAMKEGAFHYLKKPFEPDELLLLVQRALERKRLAERAARLQRELDSVARFGRLVGKSEPMQRLFALIRRAAQSQATVLLTGESGTGKELVAQAIHGASGRSSRPFVAVNCAALPENLVESELFGHLKGAFTGAASDKRGLFEEAEGGTIFLDEVGDLPLALQVKLTRVLQESSIRRVGDTRERPIDTRVIAATNVDLKQALSEGRFRQDLYYRLNIFTIGLPSLRARKDDIPALCAHFLEDQPAAPTSPHDS